MDAKFKHLDYIQTAIGRMATNSSLFKGWAITIATGLSAFGAADAKVALARAGPIAEIGDIRPFAHPRKLASWLGMTPTSTPSAINSTAVTSRRPVTVERSHVPR